MAWYLRILLQSLLMFLVTCACVSGGNSSTKQPAEDRTAKVARDGRGTPIVKTNSDAKKLLQEVPLTAESWSTWRKWLLTWLQQQNPGSNACSIAARDYIVSQADANGDLPENLRHDALAWYLLGSAKLLHAADGLPTPKDRALAAETALLRSAELNPKFARVYRNLGLAYLYMAEGKNERVIQRAEEQLAKAKQIDPKLPTAWVYGQSAAALGNYEEAIKHFNTALTEEPQDVEHAVMLASLHLMNSADNNRSNVESAGQTIGWLAKKYPHEGRLACYNGYAQLRRGDRSKAADEFDRGAALGVPLETVFPPKLAEELRQATLSTAWLLPVLAVATAVVLFYSAVIGSMIAAAFVLAKFTKGTHALKLMKSGGEAVVQDGRVIKTKRETMLSRIYLILIMTGLVLFYLAIPFILVGILGGTGAIVYGIFMLGRIPVKLVVLILVVGLGMAFGVIRSLFAKTTSGAFGVRKTSSDEPRLHELTTEVARQVDTQPVDEIYIGPGSEIGVHQEGRGPFGVFGVKRRVLTLGLASLQFLSVAELRAILAHEYAHFSHGDTYFSRFIHQVTLTIDASLRAMAEAGGMLNYVNPFYWFLVLYYRAYNMMASGFSRSREFLADRMAASLYGANVFSTALCKVVMHGTYYDVQLNQFLATRFAAQNPNSGTPSGHALTADITNLYATSRKLEHDSRNDPARLGEVKELLNENGSLFASHPTVGERLQAIAGFHLQTDGDNTPARSLLVDAEALERQLTEFVQSYADYVGGLATAANAAQQG